MLIIVRCVDVAQHAVRFDFDIANAFGVGVDHIAQCRFNRGS